MAKKHDNDGIFQFYDLDDLFLIPQDSQNVYSEQFEKIKLPNFPHENFINTFAADFARKSLFYLLF